MNNRGYQNYHQSPQPQSQSRSGIRNIYRPGQRPVMYQKPQSRNTRPVNVMRQLPIQNKRRNTNKSGINTGLPSMAFKTMQGSYNQQRKVYTQRDTANSQSNIKQFQIQNKSQEPVMRRSSKVLIIRNGFS